MANSPWNIINNHHRECFKPQKVLLSYCNKKMSQEKEVEQEEEEEKKDQKEERQKKKQKKKRTKKKTYKNSILFYKSW